MLGMKNRLARYYATPSEGVLQSVQDGLRMKLFEDVGDILEAVGGIVHPWAKQAAGMCGYLAIPKETVEELLNRLGLVVRRAKE